MTQQFYYFLGAVATFIGATWFLAWKLSDIKSALTSKISETEDKVTSKISSLDTRLTTMQAKEEVREEKITQMWNWWMDFLTHGILTQGVARQMSQKSPSGSHDIRDNQK